VAYAGGDGHLAALGHQEFCRGRHLDPPVTWWVPSLPSVVPFRVFPGPTGVPLSRHWGRVVMYGLAGLGGLMFGVGLVIMVATPL